MQHGAFRSVFLLWGVALKLPRITNLRAGMRSNRWEREMWFKWRNVFGWDCLCPVYFADPLGWLVVMPRAEQPVAQEEVDALPDYYPNHTAELKHDDYGRLEQRVVALDYGLGFADAVAVQRKYYRQKSDTPAIVIPK